MDEQQSRGVRIAFGKRVRRLREREGISLRKFALMIGVSYPYLSNVENGKQAVTIDVIDRITRGLDVEIHELF